MDGSRRYSCRGAKAEGFPAAVDPVWEKAEAVMLMDLQTGETPFLETELRILRDDAARRLLIRFSGEDDASFSPFRLRDEPLSRYDAFGLLIGEEGTPGEYLEFACSPNDVLFDGRVRMRTDGKPLYDLSLDVEGWETRTRFSREKLRTWSVWSLPFGAFSRPPKEGTLWRFNAFRVDLSVRGLSRQALCGSESRSYHDPGCFAHLEFVG